MAGWRSIVGFNFFSHTDVDIFYHNKDGNVENWPQSYHFKAVSIKLAHLLSNDNIG